MSFRLWQLTSDFPLSVWVNVFVAEGNLSIEVCSMFDSLLALSFNSFIEQTPMAS